MATIQCVQIYTEISVFSSPSNPLDFSSRWPFVWLRWSSRCHNNNNIIIILHIYMACLPLYFTPGSWRPKFMQFVTFLFLLGGGDFLHFIHRPKKGFGARRKENSQNLLKGYIMANILLMLGNVWYSAWRPPSLPGVQDLVKGTKKIPLLLWRLRICCLGELCY